MDFLMGFQMEILMEILKKRVKAMEILRDSLKAIQMMRVKAKVIQKDSRN